MKLNYAAIEQEVLLFHVLPVVQNYTVFAGFPALRRLPVLDLDNSGIV